MPSWSGIVSVNTSHAIAICCIQLPLTDTT